MKKSLVQKPGLPGIAERFGMFAATGFNAALGIHLFCTKSEQKNLTKEHESL